jgi:glucose/mannose transport system substrate-binding protein
MPTNPTALSLTVAATLAVLALPAAHAGEVEVLHYWTSPGEAKAAAALKQTLQQQGDTWKDFAVAGGGGDAAMTVLKSRVIAGNPPSAAQIKGPAIAEWAREGVLENMDPVAEAGRWDALIPKVIADGLKYQGHYVAVPVNVHRVNWLWTNPEAFRKAGAKVPATWDEFFVAAEALRKAGITPVAHGGQTWQEFELLETVALGVGGADFYRKAFVQLDPGALRGATMEKSLVTFRRIKGYVDRGAPGRDWNLATAMVIRGEAGMQFMGDWAKGEFLAAGKVPGRDFGCVAAPGTRDAYTYNVDSFALFKVRDAANRKAQQDLAVAIMSPAFQEVFNLNKGSIPVRAGVPLDKFDECARTSAADFATTSRNGGLVPSIAHDMAVSPAVQGALKDVVSSFWNDDKATPAATMDRLVAAAKVK